VPLPLLAPQSLQNLPSCTRKQVLSLSWISKFAAVLLPP
jgi:hypothetical protein